MFCPECGAPNRDELRFCTKCGSPLIDNQPVTDHKPSFSIIRTLRTMWKVRGKTIFCVAGIIVLLAAAYIAGSVISNPEAVVKRYFESIRSSDWGAMYDCMAVNESELVNKAAFIAYQESTQAGVSFDVSNYEVIDRRELDSSLSGSLWSNGSDQRSSDSKLVRTYTVNYIEAGTSAKKSMTVELILQSGKKLLFFDNYKVSAENLIVANYQIIVPKDALVFIDGVQLSDTIPQQKNADNFDVYTAPHMFAGRHDLKVTTAVTIDYEEEIYAQSGASFTVSDLRIKQSEIDGLARRTEENLRQLYSSAMTGSASLSTPVTSNSYDAEWLEHVCERIVSGVKNSDGTGLKSVYFSDFTARNDSDQISYEMIYQSTLDYKYDTVSIRYDYSNDTLTEEPSDETRTGTVSITYVYEDGGWAVKSVDDYGIYY